MKNFDRQRVQALIELSTTFEKADEVIEKYVGFKTVKEKLAFLYGMFDDRIIDPHPTPDEDAYRIILNSIIQHKWM